MLAALRPSRASSRTHALLSTTTRAYSAAPDKPSAAQLVKRLRETIYGLSITKAREALDATNNDLDQALAWLSKDMALTGAKKAAKAADRKTGQGLIGLSVLSGGAPAKLGPGSVRAAMVELNCETDFVAQNSLFTDLLRDIAHTTAFLAEHDEGAAAYITPVDIAALEGAPLLSATTPTDAPRASVGDSIRETIAKMGELIVLRRAAAVARHPVAPATPELALRVAAYAHGGAQWSQGRAAALALVALKSANMPTLLRTEKFAVDLERLERSLARQVVGLGAERIHAPEGEQDEMALYSQPFAMLAGESTDLAVGEYLRKWAREQQLVSEQATEQDGGISVLEMVRWDVGRA
jgi:elongation factor Ts